MNTTELIDSLKIQGSFPASNDLFSPADFLVLFNHQLKIDITPILMALNEDYFLQYKDFAIVEGSKYRIPARAVGTNIRDLKIVDGSGSMTDLDRLFEEDRSKGMRGYYLTRNSVELTPGISGAKLRMSYYARPSTLVLPTACAQIQGIDYETGTLEVASVPDSIVSGSIVDIIQNNNPYDLIGMDLQLSGVSGTTLNFAELPVDIEVGDWVALAVQSPVAMIPEELHPVLVQSALCKTLSSKKDKVWKDEMAVLEQNKRDALNMLKPRVQNNSTKMRSGRLLNYFSMGRY